MFFNNLSPLIKSSAAALCLAFCSVESTQADIALRLSGTVSTAAAGYTAGQEISMTIKLNPAYAQSAGDDFGPVVNVWSMPIDGRENLFDLEGTGITGSLAGHKNASGGFEHLITSDGYPVEPVVFFLVYFAMNSPFSANGYTAIEFDFSNLTSNDFSFNYPQTYIDPTTYWANYLGTYELLPGAELSINTVNGKVIFALDTLEVIPEPNSILLLSLGAGALALRRKRLAVRS